MTSGRARDIVTRAVPFWAVRVRGDIMTASATIPADLPEPSDRLLGEAEVRHRFRHQRLAAALNAVRMARVYALDAAPCLWHRHGANFLEAAALQLLEAELELVILIAGDPR